MSTNPLPPPAPTPTVNAGEAMFLELNKLGLLNGADIGHISGKIPTAGHVVEGLLPARSVNILVGDSGLGKSALAYQLGLAVAAGIPFLGMATRRDARVVMVDYENPIPDAEWILEQQRKHLGLEAFPATFLLWPLLLDPLQERVEEVVRQLAPDLVIIDSLRSFNPAMECENGAAVKQIRRLRAIAARHGTAFLLIHHVRKQRAPGAPGAVYGVNTDLEEGEALDWMLRTAGARALINQTDVRLAVARRRAGADLVLRGHFRTHGEVGPFRLRRVWDEANDGEPLGYQLVRLDPTILRHPAQEAVFERLPETFHFKDVRQLFDKHDETNNAFIHKMMRLGLVRKTARGTYQKGQCAPKAAISQ